MLKLSVLCANKTLPGLLEPKSVNHSRSMKESKGRGREAGELNCRFRSFGARNISGKHVSFTKFKGNRVSFVFILSFTFHLGENPRFEASLFKLIRKTINEGSFHEVLMEELVLEEIGWDQSSKGSSMEMPGHLWRLVQLES